MLYNYSPTSSRKNRPPTVQYQSYTPDKRATNLWLHIVAIILLTLGVAALIIDFAVEHDWFYDTSNATSFGANEVKQTAYGLWRLCFFANGTCVSWFSNDSPLGYFIEQRLKEAQGGGINAWQALEIVFLFLAASTLIIVVISISCYKFRKNFHYYSTILSVFCIWPAVSVGISGLFVFGFSVYNVARSPKSLGWCFYVNIASVVLSIGSGIFLTIYAILLKKPFKSSDSETGLDVFMDINSYEPNSNSFELPDTKRRKKKQKKAYDPSDVFHPYDLTKPTNNIPNTDYVTNPNHQMLAPYTSYTSNQHINPTFQTQPPSNVYRGSGIIPSPSTNTMPPQSWYYPTPTPPYPYEPPHWHRPASNLMVYNGEPDNDYVERGVYRPNRFNPNDRAFNHIEKPRVLHYYTGYNQFATIDRPATNNPNERYTPIVAIRSTEPFNVNPAYYQQNSY